MSKMTEPTDTPAIATPRKVMQLAVDLDSTLQDHWNRISRNSVNGVIQSSAWSREELDKDVILPGALEALQKFYEAGWQITILTSREWESAREDSIAWLEANGLMQYIEDVHTVDGMKFKLPWLQQHKCDLFIDDFMSGQELMTPMFLCNLYLDLWQAAIRVEPFRNNWSDIVKRYGV